ncbi:MAG: hypothetical protein ABGX16_04635 [Pirellulales bacterium]
MAAELYFSKPNFSDGLVTGVVGAAQFWVAGCRKDLFAWGAFAGEWYAWLLQAELYFGKPNFSDGLVTGVVGAAQFWVAGCRKDLFAWGGEFACLVRPDAGYFDHWKQ